MKLRDGIFLISCFLFCLTGCADNVPDFSSAAVVEQYLEMAYDTDFTFVDEDDSMITEWVLEKAEDSAHGFLFADENGTQFTAVSYRTVGMVGGAPAIAENYRSICLQNLQETIAAIGEAHGLTIRNDVFGGYQIQVQNESELSEAAYAILEMQELQLPVLQEPDVQFGLTPLLWYGKSMCICVYQDTHALGQFYFQPEPDEIEDYSAIVCQLERAYGKNVTGGIVS